MTIALSPEQTRVLGCLLEKAVLTPDQCPLTLNALTNACNQKSSREPVMALEPGAVARAAEQLSEQHLVTVQEDFRRQVSKFSQRLCNTPYADVQLDPAQYAVLTLLLLRGAQTPGELRSRSGRLHSFADTDEVVATLDQLANAERGPLVARLPMRAGRRDHEYCQLLSAANANRADCADSAPQADRPAATPEAEVLPTSIDGRFGVDAQDSTSAGTATELAARVAALEAQVAALSATVQDLRDALGD